MTNENRNLYANENVNGICIIPLLYSYEYK